MSHRRWVALTLTVLACRPGASTEDRLADSTAIHALSDRAAAANNTGDIEAWVALFEDGAVYMPPGSPEVTTTDGLRKAAAAGFTQFDADIRITPIELRVLGDWAFGRSRVSGSVQPRTGGKPIPIDVSS